MLFFNWVYIYMYLLYYSDNNWSGPSDPASNGRRCCFHECGNFVWYIAEECISNTEYSGWYCTRYALKWVDIYWLVEVASPHQLLLENNFPSFCRWTRLHSYKFKNYILRFKAFRTDKHQYCIWWSTGTGWVFQGWIEKWWQWWKCATSSKRIYNNDCRQ